MDRRTTIKWVLAAAAVGPLARVVEAVGADASAAPSEARGYGTDPGLLKTYHPGELWPLTLNASQRRLASILADIIIPADEKSPSASSVGAVEFIDEWVSAPYPAHLRDRKVVVEGFAWMDAEAARRGGKAFADLAPGEQHAMCEDICDPPRAAPERREAARFFSRFRDLTAGAFYTTPVGRNDLGYIGNVALAHFDGPPQELLARLGLP